MLETVDSGSALTDLKLYGALIIRGSFPHCHSFPTTASSSSGPPFRHPQGRNKKCQGGSRRSSLQKLPRVDLVDGVQQADENDNCKICRTLILDVGLHESRNDSDEEQGLKE